VSNKLPADLPDYGYVSARDLADALCYVVDDQLGREQFGGFRRTEDYSGLVFPYYHPGEDAPRLRRLRRFKPPTEYKDGVEKVRSKYLSPPGMFGQPHFYIHRKTKPSELVDVQLPIIFVEGEKKAVALRKYLLAAGRPALVVGLAGVDAWTLRGKVPSNETPGKYEPGPREPIYDWRIIEWGGRQVYILFDTNIHHATPGGENVRGARRRLAVELFTRKALVKYLDLPADCPPEINGVDDFLGHKDYGPDALGAIFQKVDNGEPLGEETVLLPHNDRGFLDRLWALYEGEFVYVKAWKSWGVWDGSRWDFNRGELLLQDAIVTTAQRALQQELPLLKRIRMVWDAEAKVWAEEFDGQAAGEKRAKAFTLLCTTYGNQRKVMDVRKLAECDSRFVRWVADFDSNPWLLNCLNGTLDLRSGDLLEPNREDYITRLAPTAWRADASCPKFDKFMQQIFQQKQPHIDYLAQVLGYCCTGDTGAQKLWYLLGNTGQNGKSVLMNTVAGILGKDYVGTIRAQSFTARNNSGHTDDLASLNGKRLIIASELREGEKWDESLIKQLTGDKDIQVSFKGMANFEMKITFKFLIPTNVLPEIRGTDGGIWRRQGQFTFAYQVPATEQVDHLEDRLLIEREGILAWMVRGLHRRLEIKNKFDVPVDLEIRAAEFRTQSDELGEFLSECCDHSDVFSIPTGRLHDAYLRFAGSRARYGSVRRFGRALVERNYEMTRSRGQRCVKGLRLFALPEDEEDDTEV